MVAVDPNSGCEQAKTYYYEYLCGEDRECVPSEILVHIAKCGSCQSEVERLKVILTESEEHAVRGDEQKRTAITMNLRFHFAYRKAFVGCEVVKLFLPSLAIPAFEVSVPTPITVHLDKCKQCASDLETIRRLKLTDNQLGRLGQLFTEELRVDAKACAKAGNAIASFGAMAFEGSSAAILKHLCVCPDCRRLIYEDRKGRSEQLAENLEQSPMPCDSVSATDIFDYVIPYGIDPARKPYVKFSKPLTSHLLNCPRCLGEMQKLHDTVYSILERQESGIVTRFKVDESARGTTVGSAEDLYEDWPIEVKVFDKSAETGALGTQSAGVEESLKPTRRLLMLKIRPFIKPGAVAAAAVLIALLLLNAPIAKAVDLGQISRALERIRNVYFAAFEVGKAEPVQEIWVSRTSSIKMLKNQTEWFFYDIKNKSSILKDLNTGSITTAGLDDAVLLNIRESMEGPLGLLPFNSMSEGKEGAQWLPVADENIDTKIAGTEVYDLVWTDKSLIGSVIYRKWRGYIDIKTKLPKRIEWWLKLAEGEDYKLETITTISYPTVAEIQARINEAGF